MAETTYEVYILWSGRNEDILHKPVTIIETGREHATEMFDNIVAEGLAVKNDGLFLGKVDKNMTEKDIDAYDENKEALYNIISGNDDTFSISEIVKKYATSHDDWLDEAWTVVYDNEETDVDVTMSQR